MKANLLSIKGTWREVADAARTTIGLEAGTGEPSSSWKRRMILAEHSPIRKLHINWKWTDLKYWVSVHLVRHKYGIEHFVQSQRPDRPNSTDNRDDAPQSTLINHEGIANLQAIINISRKRLCNQAMPETREAWQAFLETFKEFEPELYGACVPDCIYRGWCYEYKSCGYHLTENYKERLVEYRAGINQPNIPWGWWACFFCGFPNPTRHEVCERCGTARTE